MLKPNGKLPVFRIALIALTLVIALPATSFGKNQGRGRDRRSDQFDKKCAKFINCHDARDGRWDGRGPRRIDDRSRSGRFRQQDFDDEDFRRFQRRRYQMYRYQNDRYRYQNDPYYNYNPDGYQRGFNWTNLLNLFLQ